MGGEKTRDGKGVEPLRESPKRVEIDGVQLVVLKDLQKKLCRQVEYACSWNLGYCTILARV